MKTVVITGVGKGIGRALTEKFLSEGWFVAGTYLGLVPDIKHANFFSADLDITDKEKVEALSGKVLEFGKKIDVLINNAGVLLDEDEDQVVVEKLKQTLEVNLIGTINVTESLLPHLAQGAHIVNISSSAGSLTLPLADSHFPYRYPAYKISKTALNMYTRTLAGRLRESGIIVSSVNPGWTKTAMGGTEAGQEPEEVAEDIFNFVGKKVESGEFWFKGEKFPW
jgi:NAD(P)-dependent dehydrogenase (short-subunit alcohol dehydrogenase family)